MLYHSRLLLVLESRLYLVVVGPVPATVPGTY